MNSEERSQEYVQEQVKADASSESKGSARFGRLEFTTNLRNILLATSMVVLGCWFAGGIWLDRNFPNDFSIPLRLVFILGNLVLGGLVLWMMKRATNWWVLMSFNVMVLLVITALSPAVRNPQLQSGVNPNPANLEVLKRGRMSIATENYWNQAARPLLASRNAIRQDYIDPEKKRSSPTLKEMMEGILKIEKIDTLQVDPQLVEMIRKHLELDKGMCIAIDNAEVYLTEQKVEERSDRQMSITLLQMKSQAKLFADRGKPLPGDYVRMMKELTALSEAYAVMQTEVLMMSARLQERYPNAEFSINMMTE
ncbi:hypothetical protein AB1K70_24860 [Bremerella sp. JC770]|uniref:hypothetical protein n=1 Tax=Bremerella sp. JC770 TaxID=3232137 RepID=UPI00345A1375